MTNTRGRQGRVKSGTTASSAPPDPDPVTADLEKQTSKGPLLGLVLAFWFVTSAFFNHCTPQLLKKMQHGRGEDIDVTVVELLITVAIGTTTLFIGSNRLVPPPSLYKFVAAAGLLHMIGCRLFMIGLSYISVSLAQTIRASNPLFVVFIGTAFLGRRYPLNVLAALVLIVGGFAIAVSADGEINPIGVAASVGSVIFLVFDNTLTKYIMDHAGKKLKVTSGEVQCWNCEAAVLLLLPYWAYGGGIPRLTAVVTGAEAYSVLMLCALDGSLYFSEQVAQLKAISMLDPLSLAVIDTVRRLWIVFFAGFVLQGDAITRHAVLGAACVCGGALVYAMTSRDANAVTADKPTKITKKQ